MFGAEEFCVLVNNSRFAPVADGAAVDAEAARGEGAGEGYGAVTFDCEESRAGCPGAGDCRVVFSAEAAAN